jgi:1,4-alpha-glucan branching enzyme
MITIEGDGSVNFRVYLPHAAKVEVLGDFTDWGRNRVSMRRQFPGWWEVSVKVPAGEHAFCYLIDDAIHMADYAAHAVKMDSDGKWVSSVAVEGAARRAVPA